MHKFSLVGVVVFLALSGCLRPIATTFPPQGTSIQSALNGVPTASAQTPQAALPALPTGSVEQFNSRSPSNRPVFAIAADPYDQRGAYAWMGDRFLYHTHDRGSTWQSSLLPLSPDASIAAPEFSGDDLRLSYLQPGWIFLRAAGDLYRSQDYGESWLKVSDRVAAWTLDPDMSHVFVIRLDLDANQDGLYASQDSGQTWQQMPAQDLPINVAQNGTGGYTLTSDPSTVPQLLYAGTPQGIFRSLDGGASFQPFITGLDKLGTVSRLAWLGSSLDRFTTYALVEIVPPDGGAPYPALAFLAHGETIPDQDHWQVADPQALVKLSLSQAGGFYGLDSILIDPWDAQHLFIGAQNGIWSSADRGASWQLLEIPHQGAALSMALLPGFQPALLLGSQSGAEIVQLPFAYESVSPATPIPNSAFTLALQGIYGGGQTAQATSGSIGLVALGLHLLTLDLSDPAQPQLLGRSAPLPGLVQQIAAVGNQAFLATGSQGLLVMDISDPTHPQPLQETPTRLPIQHLLFDGNTGYLAERACSPVACSSLIERLDPAPGGQYRISASLELPGSFLDMQLVGGTLFVLHEYGLMAVQTGGRNGLVELSNYHLKDAIGPLHVQDGIAYLVANGLQIVDVHVPQKPVWVTGLALPPGIVSSLILADGYVYLDGQYCEFGNCQALSFVVDVNQPANAQIVPTDQAPPRPQSENQGLPLQAAPDVYDPLQQVEELSGIEGRIYLHGLGLSVLDVTDPENVQAVRQPPVINWQSGLSMAYPIAVQNIWNQGVQILDMRNPLQPELQATVPGSAIAPPGGPNLLAGNRLYASIGYGGLDIVDISQPDQPEVLSTYNPLSQGNPAEIKAITIHAEKLYLAIQNQATPIGDAALVLESLDISDPAQPQRLGHLTLPFSNNCAGLISQDHSLMIMQNDCTSLECNGFLQIVQGNNPAELSPAGSLRLSGHLTSAVVMGQLLFLSAEMKNSDGGTLYLVDLSDANRPILLAALATPVPLHSLAVLGDRIYAAAGQGGLLTVQVNHAP